MPRTINECHFAGNAGRDAEAKYTPTGKLVVKFSIAVGGGKSKDGTKEYPTEWVNCEAWEMDKTAEIRKGQFVEVWGRQKTDSWEKNGEKKYMTKCAVTKIEMGHGDNTPNRDFPDYPSAAPARTGARPATASDPITDEDIPFSRG